MDKEKFTIEDKNRAREIISDDDEEFRLISEKILFQNRSYIHYKAIVKRIDGKFFMTTYLSGPTEYKNESAFEYENADFTEVFPVEKTIIVYE